MLPLSASTWGTEDNLKYCQQNGNTSDSHLCNPEGENNSKRDCRCNPIHVDPEVNLIKSHGASSQVTRCGIAALALGTFLSYSQLFTVRLVSCSYRWTTCTMYGSSRTCTVFAACCQRLSSLVDDLDLSQQPSWLLYKSTRHFFTCWFWQSAKESFEQIVECQREAF